MDELERRVRAARPMSGNRDLPLTDRAKRELADLLLSRPNIAPHRERAAEARRRNSARVTRRLAAVAVILVAVILASTVVPDVIPNGSAQAATPAPLVTSAIAGSTAETLARLKIAKQNDRSDPGNSIRFQSWELNTEIDGNNEIVSSSIEPYRSETTFAPDGSVHSILTAAEPFPGQDASGLPTPGTVIADETLAPGEYESPYDKPLPTDAARIGTYLARYRGERPPLTAGAAIREISGLLSSVILTREQETAIISYLQTLDGLTVAGTVTDRLGREGIAFAATDRRPGEYEDYVIISPNTGSIIAAETVYIGSQRTDIASPSVVDYTAWER